MSWRTLPTVALSAAVAAALGACDDDGGGTGPGGGNGNEENVVVVRDDILVNTLWTADNVYLLRGAIFIGRDIDGPDGVAATLTIEPGTTILGDVDPPQGARGSYIVVSRGSRIVADANANRADPTARPNPDDVIVFTSSARRGQRARGDWGGLVLNGRAPINSGDEATGEGDSGFFGGNDPLDSSGVLRGVRIEFAGDRVSSGDELNGIALQGTGAGTIVDYVQVHYNRDDGTEPFGGTTTQTHMVTTGIEDDSFDGTDGYQGFMQFLIAQQRADLADNGFELSNNGDTPAAAPHSSAVVANATMIGAGATGEIAGLGANSDIGANLREGSNYRLFNNIIVGFGDAGFCVEGDVAVQNANNRLAGGVDPTSTLRFEGNILWDNGGGVGGGNDNFEACGGYTLAQNMVFFNTGGYNNLLANPNLPGSAFSVGTATSPPNVIPPAMPGGYAAVNVAAFNGGAGIVMPVDGRTLQQTNYAGAVAPGTALQDAWYFGWTVWSTNGSDSRPGLDELGGS